MEDSKVQEVNSGLQTDVKGEKTHEHVKAADHGNLEKQLSPDSSALARPDASSVDDIYERKVYILNKVLNEEIGMGKVQWQLFFLSGWGWMADNLWLQGVAIILPQVSREFNIESNIRWMTFSLYMGLILGAALWVFLPMSSADAPLSTSPSSSLVSSVLLLVVPPTLLVSAVSSLVSVSVSVATSP